ncbi:hypothetical protein BaRGS_00033635 [Batillaria attramentaria]|uniref:Uncharacterized protein n=1 Tax=Batillaria attramentaria TaxID=370345 RepID=A0ABD0JK59_9CAEN
MVPFNQLVLHIGNQRPDLDLHFFSWNTSGVPNTPLQLVPPPPFRKMSSKPASPSLRRQGEPFFGFRCKTERRAKSVKQVSIATARNRATEPDRNFVSLAASKPLQPSIHPTTHFSWRVPGANHAAGKSSPLLGDNKKKQTSPTRQDKPDPSTNKPQQRVCQSSNRRRATDEKKNHKSISIWKHQTARSSLKSPQTNALAISLRRCSLALFRPDISHSGLPGLDGTGNGLQRLAKFRLHRKGVPIGSHRTTPEAPVRQKESGVMNSNTCVCVSVPLSLSVCFFSAKLLALVTNVSPGKVTS